MLAFDLIQPIAKRLEEVTVPSSSNSIKAWALPMAATWPW
jgi:hypothetical protein